MAKMEGEALLVLALTKHLIEAPQDLEQLGHVRTHPRVVASVRHNSRDDARHLLAHKLPLAAQHARAVKERQEHIVVDDLTHGHQRLLQRAQRASRRVLAVGRRRAQDCLQHMVDPKSKH